MLKRYIVYFNNLLLIGVKGFPVIDDNDNNPYRETGNK